MGWSIGFDENWKRDIGYGVPAICDHPDCNAKIDRGLAHVCGGEPYGGERGCGLYLCGRHMTCSAFGPQLCDRCATRRKPFAAKPDHPDWITWKLTDGSWHEWRDANPEEVATLRAALAKQQAQESEP
ncbi:MAG TPA: hypothetical protein VGM85_03560 [Paraburkholderia sp.]|jgi:hypothetical protein